MEFIARVGGGAYTLVALLIGIRLVWLWARTRELPELLIGIAMLLLAGLGYPLSAVAREATELAASTRGALGAVAGLSALTGLSANTAFTWVLFRRGSAWATALVAGVCVGSLGLFAAQSLAGGWAHGELFWGLLPGLITLSYGWATVECGRYHLLLRRRMSIGLADPVVTDRFGVYAAATGMAVLINLVGWVYWWLGVEMLTDRIGGAVLFVGGTVASGLMLLAFVPPRVYLERVRARTAELG
jgi:hypothetical protein